jgi:hypothetical protein
MHLAIRSPSFHQWAHRLWTPMVPFMWNTKSADCPSTENYLRYSLSLEDRAVNGGRTWPSDNHRSEFNFPGHESATWPGHPGWSGRRLGNLDHFALCPATTTASYALLSGGACGLWRRRCDLRLAVHSIEGYVRAVSDAGGWRKRHRLCDRRYRYQQRAANRVFQPQLRRRQDREEHPRLNQI